MPIFLLGLGLQIGEWLSNQHWAVQVLFWLITILIVGVLLWFLSLLY